jgi:hypothetical protein
MGVHLRQSLGGDRSGVPASIPHFPVPFLLLFMRVFVELLIIIIIWTLDMHSSRRLLFQLEEPRMNRPLSFGIAIFLAVVGIALLGEGSKAVAGHRCHGSCSCASDGRGRACYCYCVGGRLHCRHRCCGCRTETCCGHHARPTAFCGCAGNAAPAGAAPTVPTNGFDPPLGAKPTGKVRR